MVRSSLLLALLLPACGDDEPRQPPLDVGEPCVTADECFDQLETPPPGEIICQDVAGGYCTHTCVDDTECCSVEGECDFGPNYVGLVEVCSPFESDTGDTRCFISCEDHPEAGYCEGVSPDLHCRSTGGGAANRQVCLPDG